MLERLLAFLREDLGFGDVTTESVVGGGVARGRVIAREEGVLAGMEEATLLLEHFGVEAAPEKMDGEEFGKGENLLGFCGEAKTVLPLERVVLNVMMRMSGIATATREAAGIAKRHNLEVACTRKTSPGFSYFEKKAVRLGGGQSHRFHLDDLVLLKDNHLALIPMEEAIPRARKNFTKKVEVEVKSAEEALKACRLGADIVMLDNFTPSGVEEVLMLINQGGYNVTVEVSGGINIGNLEEYAALKPNIISLGSLTTDSKWIDMSLELEPQRS